MSREHLLASGCVGDMGGSGACATVSWACVGVLHWNAVGEHCPKWLHQLEEGGPPIRMSTWRRTCVSVTKRHVLSHDYLTS